jgi:signal transduction histidine kinase
MRSAIFFSQTQISVWNAVWRIFITYLLCGVAVRPCSGADASVLNVPAAVTNLAQLTNMLGMDQRLSMSVNLDGAVWWSSGSEGKIVLKDESAVVQLELDLPFKTPKAESRIQLSGMCTALKVQDVIKLSSVPVVENDGLHPMSEKTGRVYLSEGYHPISVSWFNQRADYGLKVEYEGPELPRQQVPDDVLFRTEIDSETGETRFINGLEYFSSGGAWLDFLPYFSRSSTVDAGFSDNFDLNVRSRDDDVGLEFSGYIHVPLDGEYTFYVASDDGSRLFIGEPSLRIQSLGHVKLPTSKTVLSDDRSVETREYEWTVVEGEVTSFHRFQEKLEIDLKVKAGSVTLKVAENSDSSYTLLPGNRIRVKGLGRRIRNMDGLLVRSEIYVQRWEDLEQIYITPGIWNAFPLMTIGDMLQDSLLAENAIAHLRGEIVPSRQGTSFVLQDATGEILLDDNVSDDLLNKSIAVLGRIGFDGTNRVLRCDVFRRTGESGDDPAALPLLTSNEQIIQLSLEEAAKQYPVKVRGVITSLLDYEGAILHDGSRGIYITCWGLGKPSFLRIGDFCEVQGVTTAFDFNPFIQVSKVRKLGKGLFPEPVQPSWDQLINGSMQCNYVELEGVVESIEDHTVVFWTHDGQIKVRLNPSGPSVPQNSIGATVRMRGSLIADWDGESRRVVVGGIFLDQHRVTIMRPAPADPFSRPLKRVGDLLQFDPQAGSLQRVRVSGILIHADDKTSYLMDDELGLRFSPAGPVAAGVGDRIEVVGFMDLNGPSPLLRKALVRNMEQSAVLRPRDIESDDLLRDEYDSTLVQISGRLTGTSKRQDKTVLEIQSGLRRFLAVVDEENGLGESLRAGSQLELSGVYVGQGGNRVLGRPIDSFELLLKSGNDVRVLSNPPWWTFQRVMSAFALLIGVLLASLVWINLLHRKVEQRTVQLGDQIQKRERAEHQRRIEQERARLAHDLHDDLGAGLTEANMLAVLATSSGTSDEEKERCADEMNDLLLRMVMSLDEIVWAENPRNDTIASLAGYFTAHAQRLLELASISCGLDVAEDLPDSSLDPKYRRELFLAFKEAITNVIQHAEASKVWLRIAIEDNDLIVVVSDDGCGVMPTGQMAGADGLINMRARMEALDGTCEIRGEPGKGATVCLRAPIQKVES